MSFASVEARITTAVIRRLANARASIDASTTTFPVIFDRDAIDSPVGATVAAPTARALTADVAGIVVHVSKITITGSLDGDGEYVVKGRHPDGTRGMALLILEAA